MLPLSPFDDVEVADMLAAADTFSANGRYGAGRAIERVAITIRIGRAYVRCAFNRTRVDSPEGRQNWAPSPDG